MHLPAMQPGRPESEGVTQTTNYQPAGNCRKQTASLTNVASQHILLIQSCPHGCGACKENCPLSLWTPVLASQQKCRRATLTRAVAAQRQTAHCNMNAALSHHHTKALHSEIKQARKSVPVTQTLRHNFVSMRCRQNYPFVGNMPCTNGQAISQSPEHTDTEKGSNKASRRRHVAW